MKKLNNMLMKSMNHSLNREELNEMLFYWILNESKESISVSKLLYGMPPKLRRLWSIKDSTLRSKIAKKAKEMSSEGYLTVSTEPKDKGFRYIYTRVDGYESLIPKWFTDEFLKRPQKINCKNCVYRESCVIRLAYTFKAEDEEAVRSLKEMCRGIKKVE